MGSVRSLGGGSTSFGEYSDTTGRDMIAEAADSSITRADIDRDAIEVLYYGNFMGSLAEGQGYQGPLMAENAAILDAQATRVESACASSGFALAEPVCAIRIEDVDVVLVGGTERMTDLDTSEITECVRRQLMATADFGDVKLRAHLRDFDPDEVAIGMTAAPAVGRWKQMNGSSRSNRTQIGSDRQ